MITDQVENLENLLIFGIFFYFKALHLDKFLLFWALVLWKHPCFQSKKGFCNRNEGTSPQKFQTFWLDIFLKSIYESKIHSKRFWAFVNLLSCGSLWPPPWGHKVCWKSLEMKFAYYNYLVSPIKILPTLTLSVAGGVNLTQHLQIFCALLNEYTYSFDFS